MLRPDDIVATARTYKGSPFRHHGRLKGIAIDCAGLIIGVAHDLRLSTFDTLSYSYDPADRIIDLLEHDGLERLGDTYQSAVPGTIVLLKIYAAPRHLAIVSNRVCEQGSATSRGENKDKEEFNIIHAHGRLDSVREHIYDNRWKRRTVGVYGYRGVLYGEVGQGGVRLS